MITAFKLALRALLAARTRTFSTERFCDDFEMDATELADALLNDRVPGDDE